MSHRVAVLLLPGVLPLDLGIPLQIFGLDPGYEVVVCAEGPAVASGGVLIEPTGPLSELVDAHTVVVPGTVDPDVRPTTAVIESLRAAADRGARMLSICTGAFALAAAGLLDGRRVTTHWQEADRLRTTYPMVEVDPRPLFIDDDDVLTSAGVAAGIDLCLHVIDRDRGAAAAVARARAIVAAPRRIGDQAQFIPPAPGRDALGVTGELRGWLTEHLDRRHTIAELAARLHCSPRTLVRHFEAETGQTPGTWIRTARLDAARELLETTDRSMDQISAMVGLGSSSAMRALFRERIGVTPAQYRRQFDLR